jgi:Holliday junction DNA helicase RuvA
MAMAVLSGIPAVDLITSIRRGEVERLVRIPGVGKKTAERMVLELREKMPAPSGDEPAGAAGAPSSALTAVEQDVLSALLNLGCARPAAENAVRKTRVSGAPPPASMDFEPLFRRALELVR